MRRKLALQDNAIRQHQSQINQTSLVLHFSIPKIQMVIAKHQCQYTTEIMELSFKSEIQEKTELPQFLKSYPFLTSLKNKINIDMGISHWRISLAYCAKIQFEFSVVTQMQVRRSIVINQAQDFRQTFSDVQEIFALQVEFFICFTCKCP